MLKLNQFFIILSVFLLILLSFFNINLFLIMLIPLISFYFIIQNKLNYLISFGLAFLVALIWNILASSQYGYNQNFYSFLGINLYPLTAWTIGLFSLFLIWDVWIKKINLKNYLYNLLMIILVYSTLLIFFETLFYHVFNVQNLQTAVYSGLPICNCLHAPPWMQLSYFILGPIYFTLYYFLNLKYKKK